MDTSVHLSPNANASCLVSLENASAAQIDCKISHFKAKTHDRLHRTGDYTVTDVKNKDINSDIL